MLKNLSEQEFVGALKWGSTLKLVFLTLITYGVYSAYYVRRQTAIINSQLDEVEHIPKSYVDVFMVVSYAGLILLVPYFTLDEAGAWETLSSIADMIYAVMLLFWSFLVRSRMNKLLIANKLSCKWFNAFWTLLFGSFYVNYKVNSLCETHYNTAYLDALDTSDETKNGV